MRAKNIILLGITVATSSRGGSQQLLFLKWACSRQIVIESMCFELNMHCDMFSVNQLYVEQIFAQRTLFKQQLRYRNCLEKQGGYNPIKFLFMKHQAI